MRKNKKSHGVRTILNLLKWFIVLLVLFWLILLITLKYIPINHSMVQLERQVTAWANHDTQYKAKQIWVNQDKISPYMYLAVMAGEDQKFPFHWGFDIAAINAALRHNSDSSSIRGASTISQQTAKNLFLWDGRSYFRKALEAAITLSMEFIWDKERILTVYLNIVEFGDGIFGIEAAAQHYFHKPASKLTQTECALLASVLPNPHIYKVNAPSSHVKERQQWILKQMRQLGSLNFLKELN